jgi:NAD(P)-dependent dehydrogenase (short-subunit alcohol dehydrogenase family)
MAQRLAGKVAIVTGAGRNIGRAEALALAAEGASVLVSDIDLSEAEDTVAAVKAAGGQAVACTESAATWAGAEKIVAKTISAFGRVDILSNNAGVSLPGPIQEMTEEQWDRVVDVSLKGYAALTRFVAPHFIAQRSGVIVMKGSTDGHGHMENANYSAAKEGVAGLVRTVARDLGQYGAS